MSKGNIHITTTTVKLLQFGHFGTELPVEHTILTDDKLINTEAPFYKGWQLNCETKKTEFIEKN